MLAAAPQIGRLIVRDANSIVREMTSASELFVFHSHNQHRAYVAIKLLLLFI